MTNTPNETPTARAMREAAERRIASLPSRDETWMPTIIRRPPPKNRRTSVPHRAIR